MGKSNTNNKSNKTGSYTDFYYHFFRNILIVSLPILVISALILGFAVPYSSADNNTSSDSVSLTLSTSCTISSSVIEAHNATLNGGQHETDIGTTRVNTYCNDNNGYNIYAIGSSGDIDGNTDLIVGGGLSSDFNIKTGIYDSNNASSLANSSWGMKLIAGNGTGIDPTTGAEVDITPPSIVNNYNNYNVVPNVYTMVAKRTSGTSMTTNTTASGSYFTTTYDIYASSVQPAGTYTGKVRYLLTHPNTNAPNIINDIDAAFAMAGKQKVYQDSEGSYYAMQDMTTDICNSVSSNGERTSTQLVDIRDHKLYYVTKLADGHCWMTQNLDLDLDPAKPLTSNDTDLTDHSLAGAYIDDYNYDPNTSITTWTPERKTIDFQNTTVTGWNNDNNNPYSASKTDNTETGHASLGNWYNWTAAIASNDSSSLTQDTISNIPNNPKNSICSKGWRLPTISNQPETESGSTDEFARLYSLYGNFVNAPLYYIHSGYVRGTLDDYLKGGRYWSSTNGASDKAYFLSIDSNSIITNTNNLKSVGRSIRCLAR